MRKIPLESSLLTYLDELEFTEAALVADEHAADLASAFAEEVTAWTDVFQRERAARRAVTRAEAVLVVRNAQLDTVTLRFGAQALVEANRDRSSKAFTRFFPTAPSSFVRGNLRKQCERTRDVIVPEIEKSPAASPLLAYAEALAGGAKAALAALAARAKAKGALAGEANDVLEWKEGINLLRTTTHAELIKRAAEQSLGRTWPQDFFRQAGDAAAADGEAPAPEPKPAPVG